MASPSIQLVGNRPFLQFGGITLLAAGIAWSFHGVSDFWSLYFIWTMLCYSLLLTFYVAKRFWGRDPIRYLKPGRGFGWLATLPMTIFNRLALLVFWATLKEDAISDIGHGLHLSGRLLPFHHGVFAQKGITAVVDLCSEFEEARFIRKDPRVEELSCPNLDLTPPHRHEIEAVRDWMVLRLRRGQKVLVHCAYGHGRSYTAALLALQAMNPGQSLAELEASVKAVRPRVHLSRAQRRVVQLFF